MSIDAMKQALGALEKLWQIIDDIDTASDMAKDNDVWYRQRVRHLQQTRWQLGITTDGYKLDGGAIAALRAAIEHAERPQTHSEGCWRWHHGCAVAKIERMQTEEPVAWMYEWDGRRHLTFTDQRFVEQAHPHFNKSTPLYTSPRQWQGLTDEEIRRIELTVQGYTRQPFDVTAFARAIEAKLRERNS